MPVSEHLLADPSITARELAVHQVLADWFDALEDGSVLHRNPDNSYRRPEGAQPWTSEDLERLVAAIDDYVGHAQQVNWANSNMVHDGEVPFDAGPGYARLTESQRLAFAQDLDQAITATRPLFGDAE
jgi:hypothetical protein